MGKYGRTLCVKEKAAFVEAVDSGASMKTLKKAFNLSKEEVEANISILSFHKYHVSVLKEIDKIKADTTMRGSDKLRATSVLRNRVAKRWKEILNDS